MSEMFMAFQTGMVGIHAKIKVRRYNGADDKRGKLVESTVGRFIFNEKIPQDLGLVADRENDPYSLEVDFLCDKNQLKAIIDRCYRVRAKPSKYQSWSNFEYTCNEDSGFEDFISMKHFDES